MMDTTYRRDRNTDCSYFDRNLGICWGIVELLDADYSGDGETVYMCQGHKPVYNGGDYDGEYLPPPMEQS